MAKVLTYKPSSNKNTFLEYTERTVHTEHGSMYRIKTASGHSIDVTDDHSLATVGDDNFFKALPPAEALGAFVPIVYYADYACEYKAADIHKVLSALINDKVFLIEEYLLALPADLIRPYIICGMDRLDWKYTCKDDSDVALVGLILSRLSILYTIEENVVTAHPSDCGSVPEDGKLVARNDARKTNVYTKLPYTWTTVVSADIIPREDITYDFTVPEFPLFIGNNILVYDTMQVHVPVTEEARVEALDKMLPSKNLFSPRTLEPMMLPQQESVFGLFECSRVSKGKPYTVASTERLKMDIDNDMVKPNDPTVYKGIHTTVGLVLLNDVVPTEYRKYDCVWNKGVMSKILSNVAKNKPAMYTHVADTFKELGALFSYKMGSSFKASDFDLADLKKTRDLNFANMDKKIAVVDADRKLSDKDKYEQKVNLLRGAQALNQQLTANATSNAFNQWAYSGSKGSNSQVMQIIASPTIVADPRDRVIPIAIKTSYNEGLSPSDYWVSSYGTRKGTVGAKLSVAPGGALAKEVVGNVLDLVITIHDCKTTEYLTYPIDDAHTKDLLERFESGTNKLIDTKYIEIQLAKGHKVLKVRSPIKCHAQHGICQLCFGYNEKGELPEIGYNVGVVSAMAITEPLTQMGLSSKHTAGTAAEETVGLSTIKQFFTMPNTFAGAALISGNNGRVSRIEPGVAGGTDVYVDRKKYHAAPGRTLKVKIGDVIHAGDIMSDGIANIAKIVPHKGIDAGREEFVESAHRLYAKAGAPSIRKNFETVARGLINYVKIDDPGEHDLIEGDVVDYNHLRAEIKNSPDKVAPKFTPFQKGTTYAPQYKPDWLANFGFKYLKQNLIDNAASGSRSELHQYHPIPGYAAGATFGEGKDGKY